MTTSHTTTVLLYSSVAGKCIERVLPSMVVDVISDCFSSVNGDPLTSQKAVPPVALLLQLKVAVDPSVALTDVGVLRKTEI